MKRSFYSICLTYLFFLFISSLANAVSLGDKPFEPLSTAEIFAMFQGNLDEPLGGNVIITKPIPAGQYCRSSTVVVNFEAQGIYPAPNTFVAQLSDATGDFTIPTDIGSVSLSGTDIEGFIFGVIPGTATPGTDYRIRVISTQVPSATTIDNGLGINIQTQVAPPIPSVNVNGPLQFCFGSASTFLTSSSPVNNLWFPGGINNQPFLGVVSSGNYYTQVTGANGCVSSSVPVTITVNTPIFTFLSYLDENGLIVTTPQNPEVTICEGDSLPLVILVDGGVDPYQIIYSSDGGQQNVFFLDGASDSTVVFVTEPGTYTVLGLTDSFPTNCGITLGGANGAVTVTTVPRPEINFFYEPYCGTTSNEPVLSSNWISGGVFAFLNDPGDGSVVDANTGVISNSLPNATYTITYTVQGPNCEVRDTTTITVQPSDIVDFSYGVVCPGITELNPILVEGFTEGGVFSFNPEPNDGATINAVTGVISNLVAGNSYIVQYVSPDGECQNTGTTDVTPGENPTITLESDVQPLCNDPRGEINIAVSGGSTPYTFVWSNDAITQNISGLEAGSYTVTVTDATGCFSSETFTLENENEPSLTFDVTNAICSNLLGSITVNIIGGTPPFDIQWGANAGSAQTATVNDLPVGSYTVTVVDAAGCEVAGSQAIILEDGPQIENIIIDQTTCGNNDGSINFTITGGQPEFTIVWSNSATGLPLTGLEAGSYTVTITDENGCEISESFLIENENAFTLGVPEVIQPTCLEPQGGSIIVPNPVGGTPEFTFLWNDVLNTTTQNLTNVGGGTYKLIVTDAAGCIDSLEASINEVVPVEVQETVVNPDCGQENGSIALIVTGGTGSFTFSWSDGPTTSDRTELAVGSYQVTITDSGDETCLLTLNFDLQFENLPELEITSVNTACDVDTGSAFVNIIGGTPDFSILWEPGAITTANTGSILAPGSYTVTVTDAAGCIVTGSATVTNINVPEVSATVVNTSCGNNNGIIDLTITGGTEPFSIEWDNGFTTIDQFGLAPGDYSFVLTDAKNCVVEGSYTIEPSLAIEVSFVSQPSSCGVPTGSISVTLTNAVAPITSNWTKDDAPFASGTLTLNTLEAGTYVISGFDGAGCLFTETITIENADQPEIVLVASQQPGCGSEDGSLTIDVVNGSGNFTVLWENGSTDVTIGGLAAGCYAVDIQDENGCEASASFCLENSQAPELILEVSQPTCGAANGSINISFIGGQAPFDILWNTGSTDNPITDLGPGEYTVTVTDAGNCIAIASATLEDNGSAILVDVIAQNPSCGFDDGSITLIVSGGVEPYEIIWTGFPPEFNGPVLEEINAGLYEYTIVDAAGCELTGEFLLENEINFEITATVLPATCGLEDGEIDITIIGGSGAPLVSWFVVGESEPFAFDEDIEGLAAGLYRIVVFEKDGCVDSLDVAVGNVVDFEVTETIEAPSCGANTGSITLVIEGTTGPFTVSWNDPNNSTGLVLSNIPAGTYVATIADANDCVDILTFVVPEGPSDVEAEVFSTDASCGLCNGTAQINVTSGQGPFTIEWSNGLSGAQQNALCEGEYTVTITDINDCSTTVNVIIGGSPSVQIAATSTDNENCNESNGTATVTILSGTEPFSILWSNNETTATITGLADGVYTVTVTDANGCSADTSVTISNPNQPILEIISENPTCDDPASGSILISFSNATDPVVISLNGNPISDLNVTGLSAGIYLIELTDGANCEVSESVNLILDDAPSGEITINNNEICEGESATVTISLIGQAPFDFTYFDGITNVNVTGFNQNTFSFDVNPNTTTTYTLVSLVSQSNPSCEGNILIGQVTLTVNPNPEVPVITAEGELIICPGDEVILTSSVSDGIVWSPSGETTAVITVNTSGSYFVTVTNEFGCTAVSNTIDIEASPLPNVNAGADVTICQGSSTQLQASGADSYVWSPSIGLTGTIISNPIASPPVTTVYTVTGTNNCGVSVDTIVITVLPVVNSGLPGEISVCENETITLEAANVSGAIYSWGPASAIVGPNDEPSVIVSVSTNTSVFVTITNANSCEITDTVNVAVLPLPVAPIISAQSDTIFCEGGSVILTSTIGEGVTWSNGIENVLSILVTEPGAYTASVSDGTCTAFSNVINVSILDAPVATITPSGNQTICEGETVTLTAGEATSYQWTTPSATLNTQTITASEAGIYTLVVTNQAGCESEPVATTVSVVANPPQPTISLNGPTDLCEGDIVTLTSSATTNFTWIIDGTPSNLSTPSVSANTPGSYQVQVTNAAGCSSLSTIVNITVKLNPVPVITADSDTIVCGNDPINITLTANAGYVLYSWFPGGETSQSIVVTSPGTYFVTGTNQNGCQATGFINIIQSPTINATINSPLYNNGFNVSTIGGSDGSITTTVSGGIPEFTYAWSDNSSIVTSDRSNLPAGTYSVTITDAVGCSVELSITLTAPKGLVVPNGFTPNGDGFNDRFVVQGLEGYPSNSLTVYNRWGNIVFQQRGYANDWVGVNNNGENLPEGTYFIILEVDGFDTITGYVDLRR
ncbi:MAG: gliding motility-associated C-terminal domain-containing protein [Flavobacteriales bacterium]